MWLAGELVTVSPMSASVEMRAMLFFGWLATTSATTIRTAARMMAMVQKPPKESTVSRQAGLGARTATGRGAVAPGASTGLPGAVVRFRVGRMRCLPKSVLLDRCHNFDGSIIREWWG